MSEDFLDSIREGKFKCTVCTKCYINVWPPSKFCTRCLSTTKLKVVKTTGFLIECARSYIRQKDEIFGVIDIGGIRLIGSIDCNNITGNPMHIGLKLKMTSCGISNEGQVFYRFERLSVNREP